MGYISFLSLIFLPKSEGESKCALVYGQMNEPPGGPARVDLIGLTVAEHFCDAKGQNVLLFIGNIFHFTQVCSSSPLSPDIPNMVATHSQVMYSYRRVRLAMLMCLFFLYAVPTVHKAKEAALWRMMQTMRPSYASHEKAYQACLRHRGKFSAW